MTCVTMSQYVQACRPQKCPLPWENLAARFLEPHESISQTASLTGTVVALRGYQLL